ncbi:hypothetical protein ACOI1H_05665 [Loktanella sp. DJP18]|uniref:hypothetical protein n=1 Tax=Loktanella sp. DJP18 TaxID=3409788 RepID=UPI003BB5BE78
MPAPASAQQTPQIEESFATALIRDALLAVNHANLTGNYTTLRDYASDTFHDANTATDLAVLLQRVRAERLDLLPVLSVEPVLSTTALSLDRSIMRLSGHFPLQPRSITFDLEFVNQNGRWLIYGLAVGAFDTPAPTSAVDTPAPSE